MDRGRKKTNHLKLFTTHKAKSGWRWLNVHKIDLRLY